MPIVTPRPTDHGTITFQICSERVWLLRIHWGGKSLICPGKDCPGCKCDRGKIKGYAIATRAGNGRTPAETGLIEIGSNVLDQLQTRGLTCKDARGFTWRMERRKTPADGWSVLATTKATVPPADCPQALLPDSIETLFNLPFRIDDSGELVKPLGAWEWLNAHRTLLRKRIELNLKEIAK